MLKSILKMISLWGFDNLRKNASFSADTVQKKDGLYLHIEFFVFDRVLFNHYILLIPGGNDSEQIRKNPVDYNLTGAESIIQETLNKIRLK